MGEVETVYANLIRRFARAFKDGDKVLQDEIEASLRLFEKLWPEDVKRWNDRFGDRPANQ